MNPNLGEQEDELLALQSIFDPEEFIRDESKFSGEIRVSVELPANFNVVLKEGESLRKYDISFLPPLMLSFDLPEDYPSSSPPSFSLSCTWLTHTQRTALRTQLLGLYQATGGTVVLFSWVQFLREETLQFLDIHSQLELPSDVPNVPQEQLNPAESEPENNAHFPESEPENHALATKSEPENHALATTSEPENHALATKSEPENHALDATEPENHVHTPQSEDQCCDASYPCEPDFSTQSSEPQQNPSASEASSTNLQRASAINVCKGDQNDSISRLNQDYLNSDHQKTDSTVIQKQTAQSFNATEAEESKSNLPSAAQNHQNPLFAPEVFLNPPTTSFPCSSSEPLDACEAAAAASSVLRSPEADRSLRDVPPTPSQTVLSQILIFDAAQKEKVFASSVFDCGVCFVGCLGSQCVQLAECGHVFCKACLTEFCRLQITEGNVQGVSCPQASCSGSPTPAQVRSLVGEKLFSRFDRLLLQSTLDCMPDIVYCPRPSCASPVLLEASDSSALCSVCRFAFCVSCRKTFHGAGKCEAKEEVKEERKQTTFAYLPQSKEGLRALWEDYRSGTRPRKRLLEGRYGRQNLLTFLVSALNEDWIVGNTKACPHCFCKIQKNGGCSVMTCSQCCQNFCWICLTRLSRENYSNHFENSSCPRFQT